MQPTLLGVAGGGPIATAPPNSPRPGVGPATRRLYHVEEASDDERRIVRARLSGRGRMLGWERVVAIDGEKKDFYIRQLWDEKGSAERTDGRYGAGGLPQDLRLDTRPSPRALG